MKKITLTVILLGLLCMPFNSHAQKPTLQNQSLQSPSGDIRCASDAYNAMMLSENPRMMGSDDFETEINIKIQEILNSPNRGGGPIRLPVVVHVVHNGEGVGVGSNISDLQVLSQIDVLNEDYRKIPGSRGFGAGVDTNIEFFLAKEDPYCNPTTGIVRYLRSSLPNGGADIDGDIKPKTIWDPSRYLNMWVVQLGGGLLGYATFPGGDPNVDGVVMGYQYFGSNDAPGVNLGGAYNLGRTTTHEVGHYLGLFHTFQGCGAPGDSVNDTPPQAQPNYGCPAVPPDTCPGGDDDLIENYMDYSDDVCMDMFTAGQNVRMQAVLAGPRSSLANSTVPDTDLPQMADDGSVHIWCIEGGGCDGVTATVRVGNFGTSNLTSATINYNVNGGANEVLNWTGNLAPGQSELVDIAGISGTGGNDTLNVSIVIANSDMRACNNSDSDTFVGGSANSFGTTQVHLELITDDFSNETTWEFRDENNTLIASGGPYNGTTDDNTTFNESFDVVANMCYAFTIFDAYGDGICCGFGNGSYQLTTDDDTVIASGGNFGSSETTVIAVDALSVDEFFLNDNVSIFPNPVNSELNIKLGNANNLPDSFEVYNVLGQSVLQKSIAGDADLSVNTSGFSNGVYFIKIAKGDASLTLRFIKR
ncbi:M43 family zinc metalloprotease [Winogradskyella sp. 3972H.M.0a.05]|uniref:M43 family zinc metalloprotease n=1 Tax=Winogradskyella sp. 3972H.M.0a.05 TaxID=2950277 RepID=UPI0033959F56